MAKVGLNPSSMFNANEAWISAGEFPLIDFAFILILMK